MILGHMKHWKIVGISIEFNLASQVDELSKCPPDEPPKSDMDRAKTRCGLLEVILEVRGMSWLMRYLCQQSRVHGQSSERFHRRVRRSRIEIVRLAVCLRLGTKDGLDSQMSIACETLRGTSA